jgi:hypothetical protein
MNPVAMCNGSLENCGPYLESTPPKSSALVIKKYKPIQKLTRVLERGKKKLKVPPVFRKNRMIQKVTCNTKKKQML